MKVAMAKSKNTSNEIVIYWAPAFNPMESPTNWNMLYADPVPVLDGLRAKKTNINKSDSFFYCPAFRDGLANTFCIFNVLDSSYTYDNYKNQMITQGEAALGAQVLRKPNIEGATHLELSTSWVFFSEESVEMEVMSPYFHQTEHSKYGAMVPGTFNIGGWFRPVNAEFMMWPGIKEFKLPKDDPMFYVRFKTDKKIVLKRFVMTPELDGIARSSVMSPGLLGKFLPLASKYAHFFKTRTNSLVLKYIKENLL